MKTKTITKMYEYDGVLYTSIREIIEEQAEIGGAELQDYINAHYQATDVLNFTPTDTAKTFKELVINDIVASLEGQEMIYNTIDCDDIEIEVFELAENLEVAEEKEEEKLPAIYSLEAEDGNITYYSSLEKLKEAIRTGLEAELKDINATSSFYSNPEQTKDQIKKELELLKTAKNLAEIKQVSSIYYINQIIID